MPSKTKEGQVTKPAPFENLSILYIDAGLLDHLLQASQIFHQRVHHVPYLRILRLRIRGDTHVCKCGITDWSHGKVSSFATVSPADRAHHLCLNVATRIPSSAAVSVNRRARGLVPPDGCQSLVELLAKLLSARGDRLLRTFAGYERAHDDPYSSRGEPLDAGVSVLRGLHRGDGSLDQFPNGGWGVSHEKRP